MAAVSINALPETILLELFTHVPARQLLLHCRPVCSLWRDLIDLATLWKRKCLREGFVTEAWDQPVADWKIFYFLRSLQRNLLDNPCAEAWARAALNSHLAPCSLDGLRAWQIDSNGGDEWQVESCPGAHGTNFPDPTVKKYFVTSYSMCLKSQLVDLKAHGYWEELLDKVRPDIVVRDWSRGRSLHRPGLCLCRQPLNSEITSSVDHPKELPLFSAGVTEAQQGDTAEASWASRTEQKGASSGQRSSEPGYGPAPCATPSTGPGGLARSSKPALPRFAARADSGCSYHLRVQLTSADYIVLASFEPPPVTIHQWNDAAWTEVSHTFSDYPPGVRHIFFQHGGKDTQFWAGWYGPRVTNSSIVISCKTRNPAPSTAQPETLPPPAPGHHGP